VSTHPPLDRQVALVTGAAQGIGRAIAARLAADGAAVALLDLAGSDLEPTTSDVTQSGRSALPLHGDVCSSTDWQAAVAHVLAEFGQLDILVNNAGIAGPISPLLEYPEDAFDNVLAVNVRGVFLG
jgi:NAD(P)-dependent dehydrogenase (short-subunit alcohol dehydrogenase family)